MISPPCFASSPATNVRGWRGTSVIAKSHCLAIDVGTGSLKSALVDLSSGRVVKHESAKLDTVRRDAASVEQRPSDWWHTTCETVGKVLTDLDDAIVLSSVAVTGQMQDLIIIDEADNVLYDTAILYSDKRAVSEAQALTEKLGMRVTADTLLSKLLWVERNWNVSSIGRERSRVLIGAADWISFKLCGAHVSDPTTATTTSLADSSGRSYSVEVLKDAGLEPWIRSLPELHDEIKVCGYVNQSIAEEASLALLSDLPVIHAGGDAATTTVGAGAGIPGWTHMYVGTSGWIGGSIDSNSIAASGTTVFQLGHPVKDFQIRLGSMTTAGGCLTWIKNLLGCSWLELNQMASSCPPGSSGVLFYPHLAGERCPFVDPLATASFLGLRGGVDAAALVRSVMEGVAFNMLDCMREMEASGFPVGEEVVMVGGGSRSSVWCEIFASVLERQILVQEDSAFSGLKGAAAIAAVAIGEQQDLYPTSWRQNGSIYKPVHHELYQMIHRSWREKHPQNGVA
ncbi:hypothetical protein NDN08_002880 [Rhodosorus marinus]|uniref:Glycerol kinase n=1 Tax=Rhodosorus marinus TaxID=101924 RepID=A0AAV8UZE7_9RHOD|nr:hypothetical protein NDN08_002880 [Rhodosorus marinus]